MTGKSKGFDWYRAKRALKPKLGIAACLFAELGFASPVAFASPDSTVALDADEAGAAFITINETRISKSEFDAVFNNAVRWKYYHGKVPEAELATFQRQVASDLVEQRLLVESAKKRGIEPDTEKIKAGSEEYMQQYVEDKKVSESVRKQLLTNMRKRLEQKSLIEKLEQAIKAVTEVGADQVKQFYLQYPEKFTDPPRIRVASIVLKVEPFAGGDVWEEAYQDSLALKEKLKSGKDFSELAREVSADKSAEQGGDLGYLHEGMLAPEVEKALADLQSGETTEPLLLLEGVGIFKLLERIEPKKRPFTEVGERAEALAYRHKQQVTWEKFLSTLKDNATISIDEMQFMPLQKSNEDERKDSVVTLPST